MSTPNDIDALASGAQHLLAGKYFQLAAFVMLIYDHILTFPEEVNRIWKRKFSGASILFLINRYITPLQFIIIMDAFEDPIWTKRACNNFVVFEGASTVALVAVCQIIMILRVYALYDRSKIVMGFLMCLWLAQISVAAVSLSTGFAVPLPPVLRGCIFTGSSKIFPFIWIGPLITDTCIFGFTLWRTRRYIGESRNTTPTMHIFLRDGSLYFLTIFMANLINTIFFLHLSADLKAIGASFSQLITSVMISRLVLNLRGGSSTGHDYSTYDSKIDDVHRAKGPYHNRASFMTRTIGDLSGDFEESTSASSLSPQDLLAHEMSMINIPRTNMHNASQHA